ncbi:hypothetical protein H4R34_004129 [Dimargaris verticillata]|uniref:ELMO domain-containing protein n=1 Tax=Dimargaris verticillata TaxID=2761393 RepID=A0A9W8AYS7_9FUNG|nr:hypothetical protein H4R34_004129 [Dimargaris verticillata]
MVWCHPSVWLTVWRRWSLRATLLLLYLVYPDDRNEPSLWLQLFKLWKWAGRLTWHRGLTQLERLLITTPVPTIGKTQRLAPRTALWLHTLDQCIHHSIPLVPIASALTKPEAIVASQLAAEVYQLKQLPRVHAQCPVQLLESSLARIHRIPQLLASLETQRRTAVTWADPAHAHQLERLWTLLETPVATHSPSAPKPRPDWPSIGFQGANPCTDFRGMGRLALDSLDYYAKTYPSSARFVLACSQRHPTAWYSFAIVGINLTALAWRLAQIRHLRVYWHVYPGSLDVAYFDLVSYLIHTFNDYWFTPHLAAVFDEHHHPSTGLLGSKPNLPLSDHTVSSRYTGYRQQSPEMSPDTIDWADTAQWPSPPFTIMDFESVVVRFERDLFRKLIVGQIQPFLCCHSFITDAPPLLHLDQATDLIGAVLTDTHKKKAQ